MASITFTVKLPPALHEIAKKRSAHCKYRTLAAYIKGLVRFDAMVQGDHTVTLPMSNLPDAEQEAIDKQLLEFTEKGIGTRGQLLAHIVADISKLGKDVTSDAIVEVIRKACGSKKSASRPSK